MIFDASSIYRAIELGKIEKVVNEKTLDLCRYELGNAIWKQVIRNNISLNDGTKILKIVSKVISLMKIVDFGINPEILKISVKYNLSYYDVSYLYASISFNDILVSEDKKLIDVASKYNVKTFSIREI